MFAAIVEVLVDIAAKTQNKRQKAKKAQNSRQQPEKMVAYQRKGGQPSTA